MLILYQRTMTGPTAESVRGMVDLNRREKFAVVPLIALIVVLGFFPKPLLDVINPTVAATLTRVGVTDPAPKIPSALEGP
jgi:NADH-quinone oxidoreductase subunit M